MNDNNLVAYTNGTLTIGGTANGTPIANTNLDYGYWQQHCYPTYYPLVYSFPVMKDNKFEQAFKVAAMLIEKDMVKELTVKEFTALVKQIAEEL